MKITTNSILILFGVIALVLMACLPITILTAPLLQPVHTQPVDTNATLQAIVSQTMIAMTQHAPTQTPVPPTTTPVPPTNTPLPTATTVSYCDWVIFVKDVTITDGSRFNAGDTFTKIWRLQNRGTCTWTPDYMLVFTSGDAMGNTTAVRLPGYVAPGQVVDVSITLTAPAKSGHYTGYWMLRNPSGTLFGYGANANKAFYVDIKVDELPHGVVNGSFSYPSEYNPRLVLYFENAVTGEIIQFAIPEKSPSFSMLLANGTYYAYAWAPDYQLQGAYVNANLTMKPVIVKSGQITTDILISDFSPIPHSRGQ